MRTYRTLLRIEIGEQTYEVGETVELDLETAKEYSHALVAVDEEVAGGGNQ